MLEAYIHCFRWIHSRPLINNPSTEKFIGDFEFAPLYLDGWKVNANLAVGRHYANSHW